MSHRSPVDVLLRSLLTCLLACLGLAALAGPAFAQRSVPVTIENDENVPVPVYQAGRTPYQFTYDVVATTSTVCDAIPVPDGMMLTVTAVGVDATIAQSDTADVFLLVTRGTGSGGSYYRYRGAMEYQGAFSTSRYYTGIYHPDLFLGPANAPYSYSASICVDAPPDGYNTARGVVSGFVEALTIIDGNTLP